LAGYKQNYTTGGPQVGLDRNILYPEASNRACFSGSNHTPSSPWPPRSRQRSSKRNGSITNLFAALEFLHSPRTSSVLRSVREFLLFQRPWRKDLGRPRHWRSFVARSRWCCSSLVSRSREAGFH